jgi:hypothetical protein
MGAGGYQHYGLNALGEMTIANIFFLNLNFSSLIFQLKFGCYRKLHDFVCNFNILHETVLKCQTIASFIECDKML